MLCQMKALQVRAFFFFFYFWSSLLLQCRLLSLMQSCVLIFASISLASDVESLKTLLALMSWNVLLMFSSIYFINSGLILGSLINFDWTLVHVVREGSDFFFFFLLVMTSYPSNVFWRSFPYSTSLFLCKFPLFICTHILNITVTSTSLT